MGYWSVVGIGIHNYNKVIMTNIVEIEKRVIYKRENYTVFLDSYDKDDETTGPYVVVNNDTGIKEFQSFVQPAALEMCMKLDLAIKNLYKEFDEQDRKDQKVVPIKGH